MQKRIWLLSLAVVAGFGVQAADEATLDVAPSIVELRSKVTADARTVVSYTIGRNASRAIVGVPVEVQLNDSCSRFVGQLSTLIRVLPQRHRRYTHTQQIRLIGQIDTTKGPCTAVVSTIKTLVTVPFMLPKNPANTATFVRDVLIGNTWVQVSYKHVAMPTPKPEPASASEPAPAPAPAPAPEPFPAPPVPGPASVPNF